MRLEENTDFLGVGLIIFTVAAILWSAHSYYSSAPPGGISPALQPASGPGTDDKCGAASKICRIELEEKVSDCDEESALHKVEVLLADPLARRECQKVPAELSRICPPECHLSLESMIVVPGKLRTNFLSIPDESGECTIKARRDVAVRAFCIPD
jgi:hypothetical protein